eukprot:11525708-Ditylum_brightwellii.AAC.1
MMTNAAAARVSTLDTTHHHHLLHAQQQQQQHVILPVTATAAAAISPNNTSKNKWSKTDMANHAPNQLKMVNSQQRKQSLYVLQIMKHHLLLPL